MSLPAKPCMESMPPSPWIVSSSDVPTSVLALSSPTKLPETLLTLTVNVLSKVLPAESVTRMVTSCAVAVSKSSAPATTISLPSMAKRPPASSTSEKVKVSPAIRIVRGERAHDSVVDAILGDSGARQVNVGRRLVGRDDGQLELLDRRDLKAHCREGEAGAAVSELGLEVGELGSECGRVVERLRHGQPQRVATVPSIINVSGPEILKLRICEDVVA